MNFVAALNGFAAENLRVLEEQIRQAISEDQFICEACAPLFKGGKRLRPMLFLLCANSIKDLPPEKTMPLAVTLELIHTASLVHDDIIDTSKKRRGVETANSKYGAQIAVLVGDYLFAKAFQLVAENDYGAEVSTTLSKLVKNLCVGEIMQDRSLDGNFLVKLLSARRDCRGNGQPRSRKSHGLRHELRACLPDYRRPARFFRRRENYGQTARRRLEKRRDNSAGDSRVGSQQRICAAETNRHERRGR